MVVLFRSTNGCFAFFSQFGDKVTAFFWVVQVFVKKNIGEWRLMSVKVGECRRMVRYLFDNGSAMVRESLTNN